jgi:hypothetical protein
VSGAIVEGICVVGLQKMKKIMGEPRRRAEGEKNEDKCFFHR